ncbi:hypothetical protein HAX54_022878, partial [Datura stramonium]|nr:hypothetical protein [Datura stramonium]
VILTLGGFRMILEFDWDCHIIRTHGVIVLVLNLMGMPSHSATWHEFVLQGVMDIGLEFNKMNLIICKA